MDEMHPIVVSRSRLGVLMAVCCDGFDVPVGDDEAVRRAVDRHLADVGEPPMDWVSAPVERLARQLAAVRALIARAKAVSPSDRMTVYVGDLEQALGDRTERVRTKGGSNDG